MASDASCHKAVSHVAVVLPRICLAGFVMDGVEGVAQPLGHPVDFHAHLSIFIQNSLPGYSLSLPSPSPCETVYERARTKAFDAQSCTLRIGAAFGLVTVHLGEL